MAFLVLFLVSCSAQKTEKKTAAKQQVQETTKEQSFDLSSDIPISPEITKGTLSNGLTYYIRENSKPENKVELRLVVNAGSLQETDKQQGLAHFMEHMNFNGLKHFPKHELVNYLQNIGVKFGADLNASTGFDRTFYILPIPTDNPENLKKGFQILADWAGNALISSEEVDAERKIILEELRMRDKNASTRMMEEFLPALMNGARHADRLPIGKKEIINSADAADQIRKFYHQWYRPNNMAVIIVGDIETEKAKKMVKEYFSYLKNPENEQERKHYMVEPYTQPSAMIVTDKEATSYNFRLVFPAQKREAEKTWKDYRQNLIRNIFTRTLNHQFHLLTQSANPPYAGAFGSVSGIFGGFTLDNESFTMSLTPIDNFEAAIDSAVAVLLRVRQYGFTQNDVKNTKQKIMAAYEKSYQERNKKRSASLVGELSRNFMEQEPIPGIANEYKFVKQVLPTITAQEVSSLANNILSNSENFFALITGPKEGDLDLPTEQELLSTVKEAFQQHVEPIKDTQVATSLLTTMPTPGDIVSQKKDEQLGTTTYTLSNGVKVTVKNTDFKADEIVFSGTKFGGSGQYGAKDKSNVHYLSSVIGAMGYGQFTPTQLSDFLSGKTVSLHTGMGNISNNVSGSSSVSDFETLLKLNYLKLTEPRMDEGLFQSFLTKRKTRFQFLKANPRVAFIDSLISVMYDNSPLAPIAVPTAESLDNIDVNRLMEIYNKEFGNADGFHFFIVGNLNDVPVKSLIKTYLASLPTKGTTPTYKDNGLRMVDGDKIFKFYKGHNDKSMMLYQIHGEDIDYSQELALKADLLGQVMSIQITDTLREKMQVIYSGGAFANVSELPYEHYTVMMQLPTGPESVDIILEELADEIKGYTTNGGPDGNLHKAKKATLQKHEENMKENRYWLNNIENIMVWDKSKEFFLNYADKVKAITEQDIIDTANKLLNGDTFIGISYPEEWKDK